MMKWVEKIDLMVIFIDFLEIFDTELENCLLEKP